MNRGNPARAVDAPLAKRPFQHPPQQIVCEYCEKLGHTRNTCRIANGLCLACGSDNNSIGDCPFKRICNAAPAPPALLTRAASPVLPAPPMRRNSGPIGRGAPPPPQREAFGQAQRGTRAVAGYERVKGIQLDRRGS